METRMSIIMYVVEPSTISFEVRGYAEKKKSSGTFYYCFSCYKNPLIVYQVSSCVFICTCGKLETESVAYHQECRLMLGGCEDFAWGIQIK